MNCLCVSMLSALLCVWEEPGTEAMALIGPDTERIPADQPQRRKRSWVWNQFFVVEEFTGDEPLYVGKLHSDSDRGDGRVRYVLSGDGASSIFSLDESTGDLHALRRLDREQQASYRLRAQARDRLTDRPIEPESHFIIKVQDINDNAPLFLDGPYTAWVAERAPVGTSVVRVVATDADDPTYGTSARMVYSLVEGQPLFTVEPRTGVVRVAVPHLDRELQALYLLCVEAKDSVGLSGGLTGTTSVTVMLTDVNDHLPTFPRKSYQFRVPESAPVQSVVYRIKAVDLDVGTNAEVVYRIHDGEGTFSINTDTQTQEGVITVQKTLDYETRSSFLLRVEASNRYHDSRYLAPGPSDITTVRVLVGDVDEPPRFLSVGPMEVSEAATEGTEVGRVSAQDPDAPNSNIRYSIDSESDVDGYFHIDPTSGLISTARRLDRERNAQHNVTVSATESLGQVGKAVLLVCVTDVNDNPPVLAVDYKPFVCENSQAGQLVETLHAVDRDDPPDGHHFLFSLTAKAAGKSNFTLRDNQDNSASVLTLRSGVLLRDRPIHFLSVVISDGGGVSLRSTHTLTISVCVCDAAGRRSDCSQTGPALVGLRVAAGLGLILLTGVTMAAVAVKYRRSETPDDEQHVGENICHYDDEGGEEDTNKFDLSALRHTDRKQVQPMSQDHKHDTNPDPVTNHHNNTMSQDCHNKTDSKQLHTMNQDHHINTVIRSNGFYHNPYTSNPDPVTNTNSKNPISHTPYPDPAGLELLPGPAINTDPAGLGVGVINTDTAGLGVGFLSPLPVPRPLPRPPSLARLQMFQDLISGRLRAADCDLTGVDSLQIFSFEGSRSPGTLPHNVGLTGLTLPSDSLQSFALDGPPTTNESLSSFSSSDSDQSFHFPKEAGPKFRKLAALYAANEG